MEIAEFLLARIAEDEAVAHEVSDYRENQLAQEYRIEPDFGIGPNVDVMGPDVRIGVDRVLAECDAKRRIVADYQRYVAERRRAMNGWDTEGDSAVVKALALPYADHPDYREEWKP